MKEIIGFLHNSRERLAAIRSLTGHRTTAAVLPDSGGASDAQDLCADDGQALSAADRDFSDMIQSCNAVDAANTAELEAAILYLQNRCSPFDLVETDTADADFTPANDVSADVTASAAPAISMPPTPASSARPVATSVAETAGSDRFGFSETSLFHAGQDWIALDERRIGKAPAA